MLLKEIVWQNKADQIKLQFLMIVQGIHSKLEFPLPKYPLSQKFAPLPPLVSSVRGGKITFLDDFRVNFLPGYQLFQVKKKAVFSMSHPLRNCESDLLYSVGIEQSGHSKMRGVQMLFFNKTSILAASHLINFLFIHISSFNSILNSIQKLSRFGQLFPDQHAAKYLT